MFIIKISIYIYTNLKTFENPFMTKHTILTKALKKITHQSVHTHTNTLYLA